MKFDVRYFELLMNVFKSFFSFINQPYPEDLGFKAMLKTAFGIGVFIFLFLSFFSPSGMDELGSKLYLYTAYFGLVTFVVIVLFESALVYVLKLKRDDESWTFWKWLVSVLVLIGCIAIANYFLQCFLFNSFEFYWRRLRETISTTYMIGLFPTFFFGALNLQNKKLKNQAVASAYQPDKNLADTNETYLKIEKDGKDIRITHSEILFIEAMQNYVSIHFVNENGLQKIVQRIPISNIEKDLDSNLIIRCHRSFIVNKSRIITITGNAQGLKLSLEDTDSQIPVSRKYISLFK